MILYGVLFGEIVFVVNCINNIDTTVINFSWSKLLLHLLLNLVTFSYCFLKFKPIFPDSISWFYLVKFISFAVCFSFKLFACFRRVGRTPFCLTWIFLKVSFETKVNPTIMCCWYKIVNTSLPLCGSKCLSRVNINIVCTICAYWIDLKLLPMV